MQSFKFSDIPDISPSRFQPENALSLRLIPLAVRCTDYCEWTIDKSFAIVGWNRLQGSVLMGFPDSQKAKGVAIMLWSREHEYIWQHVPILKSYEEDTVFICSGIVD